MPQKSSDFSCFLCENRDYFSIKKLGKKAENHVKTGVFLKFMTISDYNSGKKYLCTISHNIHLLLYNSR